MKAPHKPPGKLPDGKMAVYVFLLNDLCLKVGKVGPQSHARYVSQHYHAKSSGSNLAKSVLHGKSELNFLGVNELNVGDWIKENTDRVNFLLDRGKGVPLLNLLESYLQCRLKPIFEGFESQK